MYLNPKDVMREFKEKWQDGEKKRYGVPPILRILPSLP